MISDFEARLAEVLGTRIGAPFVGRVDVAPGPALEPAPRVILGVTAAESLDPDLGSARRNEVVPGAAVPRRAMRLRCTVSLEARADPIDRPAQLQALDALLYALDVRDLRDGSGLTDAVTDRGFVIHEISPVQLGAPLEPDDDAPVALRLTATGLFWPIGVVGEAGTIIGEIRFRGSVLPLEVTPADPLLVAGGSAVELTIRFTTAGILLKSNPPSIAKLPFDAIAVALTSAGGKPGKGTLGGGTATPSGLRILPVAGDAATLTYTPPAAAGTDELIVGFEDGEGGMGIEIGRVPLRTRSGG